MATRDELHSTRGRANILREFISNPGRVSWADNHDIISALDLCLSCKACKSECPSGVDMAKLKAEFMQNHYDGNPMPFEVRLIAHYPAIMNILAKLPKFSNLILQYSLFGLLSKKIIGFAPERNFPKLSEKSLSAFLRKRELRESGKNGKVYLFNDEFLNSTDAHIGIKAIRLLERLGYEVVVPHHVQSGRTYLSKGLVRKAQKIALKNIMLLSDLISEQTPLIGIEPSAILSFRDEYPELVPDVWKEAAKKLANNALMFDEFIVREVNKGLISPEQFTSEPKIIKLHGHCHQKSLATTASTRQILSLPVNYKVDEIPSGCCGMAGSFGYEKKHYELSMKIGEMVLFPAVRKAPDDVIVAAPGTSCREQISHGTGKKAVHPVEVLYDALL
jgi:Fe-S oxidoreductase